MSRFKRPDMPQDKPPAFMSARAAAVLLCVAAVLVAAFLVLLASVPPVSRDALTHHLAVPDIYMRHGKIVELPHLSFSYYPMNLDLLYWAGLAAFGRDIVPKYIHLAFGLFTFGLIYIHLRPRTGPSPALLGALLFLSVPVVMRLAISAYVDLGLIFFSFAAMMLMIRFFSTGTIWTLAASAVCCGLAMGIKYNGILVLVLLAPACVIVPVLRSGHEKIQQRYKKPMLCGLLFVSISMAVFSPWMARNVKWTGNPFYPMAASLFNSEIHSSQSFSVSHFQLRRYGYGEPWWQIALIPVRIFFEGKDDDPKGFDGRLNPYLLLLPLAAMAGLGRDSTNLKIEKIFFLFFSIGYFLLSFWGRDIRMRYLGPILPPLAVLSVYGLGEILFRINLIKGGFLPGFARVGTWAVVWGLLFMNLNYAASLYASVQPLDYLSGKVSRDQYITARFPVYPVFQYANAHLDESSVIMALFLGGKGYYCMREIRFDLQVFQEAVTRSDRGEQVRSHLARHGITHLLIRLDLFNDWIGNNFTSENVLVFKEFMEKKVNLLYETQGYMLFSITTDTSHETG